MGRVHQCVSELQENTKKIEVHTSQHFLCAPQATAIQAMPAMSQEARMNSLVAAREYNERMFVAARVEANARAEAAGVSVEDNVPIPAAPVEQPMPSRMASDLQSETAHILRRICDWCKDPVVQVENICSAIRRNVTFLQAHANFALHLYGTIKTQLESGMVRDHQAPYFHSVAALVELFVPGAARRLPAKALNVEGTIRSFMRSYRKPPHWLPDIKAETDYKDAVVTTLIQHLEVVGRLLEAGRIERAHSAYRAVIRYALKQAHCIYEEDMCIVWDGVHMETTRHPDLLDDPVTRLHYLCMKAWMV